MKPRIKTRWLTAAMAGLALCCFLGQAQAETITLKSDADTLGASLGYQATIDDAAKARLESGDITGLTFSAVLVDSLGSWTPIPTGAPTGTELITLPGGTYYNGENGFFKLTFSLPSSFTNVQMSGVANADDCGRLFLNGNPLTPSIYDAWNNSNGITQFGNYAFATSNQAFFQIGENVIVVSDADFFSGGPSAAAFYVNIEYQTVPLPGAVWLLGSGLLGLLGKGRRFRRN